MAHYENTQGIEWKVSVGVWTLLAAAIGWAARASTPMVPGWVWFVAVGAHTMWLLLVHESQEKDKELWVHYRGKVEEALGDTPGKHKCRSLANEVLWLFSEVGVTAVLAYIACGRWAAGEPLPVNARNENDPCPLDRSAPDGGTCPAGPG